MGMHLELPREMHRGCRSTERAVVTLITYGPVNQKPWLDQGHEPQTKLMPTEAARMQTSLNAWRRRPPRREGRRRAGGNSELPGSHRKAEY